MRRMFAADHVEYFVRRLYMRVYVSYSGIAIYTVMMRIGW